MLMAASWPSNRDAAVTNLNGVFIAGLLLALMSAAAWFIPDTSGLLFMLFTACKFCQRNVAFIFHTLQVIQHDFQVSLFNFQFGAFFTDT